MDKFIAENQDQYQDRDNKKEINKLSNLANAIAEIYKDPYLKEYKPPVFRGMKRKTTGPNTSTKNQHLQKLDTVSRLYIPQWMTIPGHEKLDLTLKKAVSYKFINRNVQKKKNNLNELKQLQTFIKQQLNELKNNNEEWCLSS